MTEINEGTPSAGGYRREDVLRIADVTEGQLRTWEKKGLGEPRETFGFSDLLALKTLKKLRDLNIAPKQIQRAITSLKTRLADIDHPLAQLRITAEGGKITVHIAGNMMEPVSGQLLLDFDAKEIEKLRSFPVTSAPPPQTPAESDAKERLAEQWFQRG